MSSLEALRNVTSPDAGVVALHHNEFMPARSTFEERIICTWQLPPPWEGEDMQPRDYEVSRGDAQIKMNWTKEQYLEKVMDIIGLARKPRMYSVESEKAYVFQLHQEIKTWDRVPCSTWVLAIPLVHREGSGTYQDGTPMTEENGEHLFHGTNAAYLEGILKEGALPARGHHRNGLWCREWLEAALGWKIDNSLDVVPGCAIRLIANKNTLQRPNRHVGAAYTANPTRPGGLPSVLLKEIYCCWPVSIEAATRAEKVRAMCCETVDMMVRQGLLKGQKKHEVKKTLWACVKERHWAWAWDGADLLAACCPRKQLSEGVFRLSLDITRVVRLSSQGNHGKCMVSASDVVWRRIPPPFQPWIQEEINGGIRRHNFQTPRLDTVPWAYWSDEFPKYKKMKLPDGKRKFVEFGTGAANSGSETSE